MELQNLLMYGSYDHDAKALHNASKVKDAIMWEDAKFYDVKHHAFIITFMFIWIPMR